MKTPPFLALLVLPCLLSAPALADVVEGRVAKTSTQAMAMTVYDAEGRPYPNRLTLQLDRGTEYVNVAGVRGLKSGDPVRVDAEQLETGAWRAASVTRFEDLSVKPQTRRTPPTMRDVLGAPVVRGALTGAATGAIASSASGGKAGKGALIGAGIGAGAGLLESLFSGQGQQRSDDTQ